MHLNREHESKTDHDSSMNHTAVRQRQRVTQRIKHIPDNISSSIDSGDTFCPEDDTTARVEDISTDVTNLVPVLPCFVLMFITRYNILNFIVGVFYRMTNFEQLLHIQVEYFLCFIFSLASNY